MAHGPQVPQSTPLRSAHHILEFYSVDAAGNVEQTHSVSFDVMNRYDDTDELITWSGAWGSASITGVYDGSIHYAMSSPASATFAFHGTGFDLISFMSSKYGLAQVSIDGGPAIDVDMYRASATLSDVSYSVRELADTTHTVEVWRVGEITSGTAANVSIDAIDVVGTLVNDAEAPTINRYDDTDELITWTGAWGSASITGVYDGSIHYAMSSPASATFAFHGTGFDDLVHVFQVRSRPGEHRRRTGDRCRHVPGFCDPFRRELLGT